MADGNKSFTIVYNSDLIIRDPSEAATLCVFYDQVLLPHVAQTSSLYPVSGDLARRELQPWSTFSPLGYERAIKEWEQLYGTLFDAEVLLRLSPAEPHKEGSKVVERFEFYEEPILSAYSRPGYSPTRVELRDGSKPLPWGRVLPNDRVIFSELLEGRCELRDYGTRHPYERLVPCQVRHTIVERRVHRRRDMDFAIEPSKLDSILSLPVYRQVGSGGIPYVSDDLVIHLLRTDIEAPQIFTALNGKPGRDILVALEAEATFSYLLPKLHLYHPVQILELREKVAGTREGFTMHLLKLSKGLEERAKENTSIKEIARFADDLIKTELIPDFVEFRRQLKAMEAGRWSKVLDAAGRVAEVDAAPWTPRFWALLLRALGITVVTSGAELKETLSNQYQAFKFMSELESAAARFNVQE